MSLGLLTALLIASAPAQTSKSAELPVDPHVTCGVDDPSKVQEEESPNPIKEIMAIVEKVIEEESSRTRSLMFRAGDWEDPVKEILTGVHERLTGANKFGNCVNADCAKTGGPVLAQAEKDITCPYLRQQAKQPAAGEPVIPDESVSDKLEQLRQARSAFEQAEHCYRTGDMEAAMAWYQQAKQVCPGSPISSKIDARIVELTNQQGSLESPKPTKDFIITVEKTPTGSLIFGVGVDSSGNVTSSIVMPQEDGCYSVEEPETLDVVPPEAEEEESEPGACNRSEVQSPNDPVEARVAELVEACQRAIADDDRESAEALIYQALLLDPGCVAVNALQEKLQGLDRSGNQPKEDQTDAGMEDSESTLPIDPVTTPDETLQPSLPPVDPGIVNALEAILRETGEPTVAKLVISAEEPNDDSDPNDPVSEWRPGPSEIAAPSLLEDPEADDSSSEDSDTDEENPPADDEPVLSQAELEQILREACQSIKHGDYVSLNGQAANGPNYALRLRIGGLQCLLAADEWGHRFLIVRLVPEASGDLRLIQETHNGRVKEWIDAYNSGGNLEETASEPADFDCGELDDLRDEIEGFDSEPDPVN